MFTPYTPLLHILNKKETSHAYLKYDFSKCEGCFAKKKIMYKLREVFTALKINITTEASKLMPEDQFDVRKGPNLKMHFRGPYFTEMINSFGISIW